MMIPDEWHALHYSPGDFTSHGYQWLSISVQTASRAVHCNSRLTVLRRHLHVVPFTGASQLINWQDVQNFESLRQGLMKMYENAVWNHSHLARGFHVENSAVQIYLSFHGNAQGTYAGMMRAVVTCEAVSVVISCRAGAGMHGQQSRQMSTAPPGHRPHCTAGPRPPSRRCVSLHPLLHTLSTSWTRCLLAF